jgi:hypothetical protein
MADGGQRTVMRTCTGCEAVFENRPLARRHVQEGRKDTATKAD